MSFKHWGKRRGENPPFVSIPKKAVPYSRSSGEIYIPWALSNETLRVRVKDGFLDATPYNAAGDVLDMSGFTGTCNPKAYEEAAENDGILVLFDSQTRERIPEEYVEYSENADEFPFMYYYFRSDLERID